MNLDLVACPACRTMTEERIDVRTTTRHGDVLRCECGRRYPVIDEVPIVFRNLTGYLRSEIANVIERDMPLDVQTLIAEGGPDDAVIPALLSHLSIYLDAHWGDCATPEGTLASSELVAKVRERASAPVDLAVELGCSAGRYVAELAAGASHVVGLDSHAAILRRARKILSGERVDLARRLSGRYYERASITAGSHALSPDRFTLVCGDALEPPLIPRMFGRVAAFNVLDSLRSPRQLLAVMDGLCEPGGELLLSSPYYWQSYITDEHDRLGGTDPAAELVRILTTGEGLSGPYTIEDQAEQPWTLRRDARSSIAYRIHYVRARKA